MAKGQFERLRRCRANWRCRGIALLSGLLLVTSTFAGDINTSLQLRLETGSHTAAIRAASIDSSGRFVVTASEDKTARVWDAVSGALLSIFRPPSDAGNNGKLFAVTMLPDGTAYATAGWSASNDIYLVSRSDGTVIHRIAGLPNTITHLAFSPDGRLLVVGLWGRHGVRVFSSGDRWQSVRELQGDANFAGEVNSSVWSPDGQRLVVSAADGYLRTYKFGASGLRLLTSDILAGVGTPHGMAFSPDGKRLAVGATDQATIALIDPVTLKLERILSPPASNSTRGFNAVAWSVDGKRLFAGGSWTDQQGHFAVCIWPDERNAVAECIPVTGNTITGLQATTGGRLLYVAADPGMGMLAPTGKPLFQIARVGLDFRNQRSRFQLSTDASALMFGSMPSGPIDAAYDIRQMGWTKPGKEWTAPRTKAGKTVVENWFERQLPQISGKTVNLDAGELSLSAAVSRNGDTIAIATSQNLVLLDQAARERWRVPARSTPWQINLSNDGRWVVAAFSDGTLRWYKVQDGSEQLALFPHPDGRRWVAWTPTGYFAASAGGEDLIGWQLDRGESQAADFYPISRFRAEYYRPDLIPEIIAKGSAESALAAISREGGRPGATTTLENRLPPKLRILAPDEVNTASGSRVTTLRLAVRTTAEAPITRLIARINGQLVQLPGLASLKRSLGSTDENIYEVPIPLVGGDSTILALAENKYGFSPEAILTLKAIPAAKNAQAPLETISPTGPDLRPVLYVMAIGISNYGDPSIRLEFAAKDSKDLSSFLKTQEGGLYRKVVVRLLTDGNAKRDDILDGLEWIRHELTARDVAVIFLAGHGVNDADGVYYFLPQDVDIKRLKRTAVIFTEIRNTLASLPGKVLFFIDTCHAGNVLGTGLRSIRSDTTAVVNELSSADNGVIVFAAATGRQFAQESSNWGNGAFTKAILEGLGGKADFNNSGRITHKMLDLYISERVKRLTEGAQSPVTIVPNGVPDFPLAFRTHLSASLRDSVAPHAQP